MDARNGKQDVFTDMNGVVATFLDDIADRPIPKGSEPVLSEIRQAVDAGKATSAMALTIIKLFPDDEPRKSTQRRVRRDR